VSLNFISDLLVGLIIDAQS